MSCRKKDIQLYFRTLRNVGERASQPSASREEERLFKIMKSNFLLMLYNFVEAVFRKGMEDLYNHINDKKLSYSELHEEIQTLWRDFTIKQVYLPQTKLDTYTASVQNMMEAVANGTPLTLDVKMLDISGNLDAPQINKILLKHQIIRDYISDRGELGTVKERRNQLAHGNISFSEGAQNDTLSDLERYMKAVFTFMETVLQKIDEYDQQERYRA